MNLKNIIKKTGIHKLRNVLKSKIQAFRLSGRDKEDIFTDIYKHNTWNGKESISGEGSDLLETRVLLDKLPDFLTKYQIKTVIDLPCGDYNWMQHLDYKFNRYTGIDIVEGIIDRNSNSYNNDNISFVKKDCLADEIGSADLLLCRDLLIHFSNNDIKRFFRNITRSEIKYILTTHFIDEKNTDIATGQWRPVNLMGSPFHLPEPIDFILEETKMFNGRYAKIKAMALWRMADIKLIFSE